MYKQIESSEGNYGCEHILYYVEGSNRTINRFVEKRANDIMLYLRNNHIPCIRVSVMGVDFFGTNSLKNLFLRQEPTLTPSELKKKIKEFQNIKRDGRFIYSAINNYNEDGAATYITYEETISYSSSTYKKDIYKFLDELATNEQQRTGCTATCFYTPSYRRRHRYRMVDGPIEEVQQEFDTPWDNSAYAGTDLLAESLSGSCSTIVSPIKIDEKYNISLPLYPQIKIKLEPLPKTIYILLLRHPEGIILKEISNYTDEIRSIYCRVSGRQNPSVINRLMAAVTNPVENPIHKNISLIRHSFLSKLNFEIARNYIPTSGRYKAQHIPIEEHLVEIPQFA